MAFLARGPEQFPRSIHDPVRAVSQDELIKQPRLSDAGITNDIDHTNEIKALKLLFQDG